MCDVCKIRFPFLLDTVARSETVCRSTTEIKVSSTSAESSGMSNVYTTEELARKLKMQPLSDYVPRAHIFREPHMPGGEANFFFPSWPGLSGAITSGVLQPYCSLAKEAQVWGGEGQRNQWESKNGKGSKWQNLEKYRQ